MAKRNGHLTIEETDNGWIVETSYFCFGAEHRKVFTKWADVVRCVSKALRQEDPYE